jgi:hypothetical protein
MLLFHFFENHRKSYNASSKTGTRLTYPQDVAVVLPTPTELNSPGYAPSLLIPFRRNVYLKGIQTTK